MEGEKRNYDNCSQNTRLIDPDLTVIAGLVVSGLAAIAALYPIVSDKKLKKEREEKFENEFTGFREEINEITFSLHIFRISINDIDRIINKASKRQDNGIDILNETMQYGKISLYLHKVEFDSYSLAYKRIMDSIYLYNVGLLNLERFLSDFSKEMTNKSRLHITSELDILAKKFNEIDIKKITYLEFVKVLKYLLEKIKDVIYEIRNIYI